MELDLNTKLSDLFEKYPFLPDEMVKLDSRLKIFKSPVGKVMAKRTTLGDFVSKSGVSEEDMIAQFQEMIDAHS